ncbi:hypothetical protein UA08_03086 [Talaromyces atroroseus]|uniref:Uncharacterized protein n=1 Tax=Talaromyces atroroseus TaxID=1441469 RepID=A0A225ASX6_TALAT|nr:hypothetical protein UA08_03086 [Talaromyces atroroseus]OKL61454.1 hypothetical protein UA08_03086 [Talaromyces atroroseus]
MNSNNTPPPPPPPHPPHAAPLGCRLFRASKQAVHNNIAVVFYNIYIPTSSLTSYRPAPPPVATSRGVWDRPPPQQRPRAVLVSA